jgi:hypothetical protein
MILRDVYGVMFLLSVGNLVLRFRVETDSEILTSTHFPNVAAMCLAILSLGHVSQFGRLYTELIMLILYKFYVHGFVHLFLYMYIYIYEISNRMQH